MSAEVFFFFLKEGDSHSVRVSRIDLSTFAEDQARRLFDIGVVSPHGHEGKTVVDESYRRARELKVRLLHSGSSKCMITKSIHF